MEDHQNEDTIVNLTEEELAEMALAEAELAAAAMLAEAQEADELDEETLLEFKKVGDFSAVIARLKKKLASATGEDAEMLRKRIANLQKNEDLTEDESFDEAVSITGEFLESKELDDHEEVLHQAIKDYHAAKEKRNAHQAKADYEHHATKLKDAETHMKSVARKWKRLKKQSKTVSEASGDGGMIPKAKEGTHTVRDLRRSLFNVHHTSKVSKNADKLRRELFEKDDQDAPAHGEYIERHNEIMKHYLKEETEPLSEVYTYKKKTVAEKKAEAKESIHKTLSDHGFEKTKEDKHSSTWTHKNGHSMVVGGVSEHRGYHQILGHSNKTGSTVAIDIHHKDLKDHLEKHGFKKVNEESTAVNEEDLNFDEDLVEDLNDAHVKIQKLIRARKASHASGDPEKAEKLHGRIKKLKDKFGITEGSSYMEDLQVLVDADANLTEDFKSKASIIFEAAVTSRIAEEEARLQAEFEKTVSEATEKGFAKLAEKIDSYLTYAIEGWVRDNDVAIETGIRTELAENFISSMKTLFDESYIEVPESKRDLYSELESKVKTLEESAQESEKTLTALKEENEVLTRAKIISEESSSLADTQAAKLSTLVEGVEFVSEEIFRKKVSTVRDTYFGGKATSTVINEDANHQAPRNSTTTQTTTTIIEGDEGFAPARSAMDPVLQQLARMNRK